MKFAVSEGQFTALRLPYKGGQLAALALLPDAGASGGAGGLVARIGSEPGVCMCVCVVGRRGLPCERCCLGACWRGTFFFATQVRS